MQTHLGEGWVAECHRREGAGKSKDLGWWLIQLHTAEWRLNEQTGNEIWPWSLSLPHYTRREIQKGFIRDLTPPHPNHHHSSESLQDSLRVEILYLWFDSLENVRKAAVLKRKQTNKQKTKLHRCPYILFEGVQNPKLRIAILGK